MTPRTALSIIAMIVLWEANMSVAGELCAGLGVADITPPIGYRLSEIGRAHV